MKNKDLSRIEKILRLINRCNVVSLTNITTIEIKKDKDRALIVFEDKNTSKRESFEIDKVQYEKIFSLKWE